jgi:hypothetical protein
MLLKHTLLKPSPTREPYFDGWDTTDATYRCECPKCKAEIAISFDKVHAAAWDWMGKFSLSEIQSIEILYPEAKKFPRQSHGRKSSISEVTCSSCNASYIFYADVDEYRQSAFHLFAQGLAYREIEPLSCED